MTIATFPDPLSPDDPFSPGGTGSTEDPSDLLQSLVPLIRRDERSRCLAALAGLPVDGNGVVSPAYRAGFEAALAAAERAIELMPVAAGLPGLADDL